MRGFSFSAIAPLFSSVIARFFFSFCHCEAIYGRSNPKDNALVIAKLPKAAEAISKI
jgi:hypothetical protein